MLRFLVLNEVRVKIKSEVYFLVLRITTFKLLSSFWVHSHENNTIAKTFVQNISTTGHRGPKRSELQRWHHGYVCNCWQYMPLTHSSSAQSSENKGFGKNRPVDSCHLVDDSPKICSQWLILILAEKSLEKYFVRSFLNLAVGPIL